MKKLFVLISILIILTINSFALNLENEINTVKSEIEGKDLPGPVGVLFGNERINAHITLNNGEKLVVGLVTEDKKVKSISTEAVENPGLNINTDETTIMQIQNSNNPLVELKKALDNEKVSYQAIGFWKKIKFSFLSFFSKFSTSDGEEVVKGVEGGTEDKVPPEQPSIDWSSGALEDMQGLGCLDDSKLYDPEGSITRAEVAQLLACLLTGNDIPAAADSSFSDVSTGHESADAIEYLASLDVVKGYDGDNSNYGPDDLLTREQSAKMLVEAYNLEEETGCDLDFSDMDEISDWAMDYIQTVYCLSIIDGYPDGSFQPANNVNWAEISTFANRANNYDKDEPKSESEISDDISDDSEDGSDSEESTETSHVINVNNDGFSPNDITINVGDTVTWKNVRTGAINQMMILGTQSCFSVKSSVILSGQDFSWKFEKSGKCTIVDGITTTQTGKITII